MRYKYGDIFFFFYLISGTENTRLILPQISTLPVEKAHPGHGTTL